MFLKDVLTVLQDSLRQVLLLLSSPVRSFRPSSDGSDVGGGGEAGGGGGGEKEMQRKWSQVTGRN